MAAQLTARDIIRAALEVEATGRGSYEAMMSACQDPELTRLLAYLAGEESEHVAIFNNMFREVEMDPTTMPDPSPEDAGYLEAIMKSVVFEGRDAGIKRAREARSPLQMLEFAQQFERDAMLFWVKLFKLVREKDRPLVQKLIVEEEKHVKDIDSMISDRRRREGKPFKV